MRRETNDERPARELRGIATDELGLKPRFARCLELAQEHRETVWLPGTSREDAARNLFALVRDKLATPAPTSSVRVLIVDAERGRVTS